MNSQRYFVTAFDSLEFDILHFKVVVIKIHGLVKTRLKFLDLVIIHKLYTNYNK